MFTGERLREILTLKWTDINFERGVDQSFRQQTGKKTIVMSAVTADLLKDSVRRGTFAVRGRRSVALRSSKALARGAAPCGLKVYASMIFDTRLHPLARAQVSDFLLSASFLAIRSERPPRAMRIDSGLLLARVEVWIPESVAF